MIEVKARKGSISAKVEIGEDLADAVKRFGEEITFNCYCRAAIIAAQSRMRGLLIAGKSPAEITAEMLKWHPGLVMRTPRGPKAAVLKAWEAMGAAEREELMEELMRAGE